MKEKKIRESNFEMLRIIAMIMVITLHFMQHGGILDNVKVLSANFFIANLMQSFSIYAVNLFILISAYFMSDSEISIKKVINIWTQVVFYTIGIYVILLFTGLIKFNSGELIKSLLPIIFNQYSFVTGYIVLMILSPFLNKLINSMNRHEYTKFIIINFMLFIILGIGFPISNILSNYISTFIILYFISAYIKKYIVSTANNNKYYLLLYVVCSLLIFIGRVLLYVMGKGAYANSLLAYNFIVVIVGSIGLFIFFINIRIQSKIINNLSVLVFGVYLIHDNFNVRSILYTKLFRIDNFYNNKWLILITVICIITVFSICIIIEYLRIYLFDLLNINKSLINIVDKYLNLIINNAKKIKNKICRISLK